MVTTVRVAIVLVLIFNHRKSVEPILYFQRDLTVGRVMAGFFLVSKVQISGTASEWPLDLKGNLLKK
jgi:hypothetical protein